MKCEVSLYTIDQALDNRRQFRAAQQSTIAIHSIMASELELCLTSQQCFPKWRRYDSASRKQDEDVQLGTNPPSLRRRSRPLYTVTNPTLILAMAPNEFMPCSPRPAPLDSQRADQGHGPSLPSFLAYYNSSNTRDNLQMLVVGVRRSPTLVLGVLPPP